MLKVFISYLAAPPEHAKQVARLAGRLLVRFKGLGVEVVFDQFFLKQSTGGPPNGWPMWCSEQVQESDRVLIILSPKWADRFSGSRSPGQEGGNGAACEARIIWQELYESNWISSKFRICIIDETPRDLIPPELRHFHTFHSPKDEDEIAKWVLEATIKPPQEEHPQHLEWIPESTIHLHLLADRDEAFNLFKLILAGKSGGRRMLIISAKSNYGKTALIEEFMGYAQQRVRLAVVDLKQCSGQGDVLSQINGDLQKCIPDWIKSETLEAAMASIECLANRYPILLLFDTYDDAPEEVRRTIELGAFRAIRRAEGLCIVISCRIIPPAWERTLWWKSAHIMELKPLTRPTDWELWVGSRYPNLNKVHIEAIALGLNGIPGAIAPVLRCLAEGLPKE